MIHVRARRSGFGFWVIMTIVIILMLSVMGGASHWQNRELTRTIAESYLGRIASQVALSAVEETYWRLTRHMLTPTVDSTVKEDWAVLLLTPPDDKPHKETIPPRVTRHLFQQASTKPTDYTVEEVGDVQLELVRASFDVANGFQSGVVELEASARLRIGAFPAGVAVTRRLRVRKRYYCTQATETQSPVLRFMSEDVSREVLRQ
jgi:hypothetical protein